MKTLLNNYYINEKSFIFMITYYFFHFAISIDDATRTYATFNPFSKYHPSSCFQDQSSFLKCNDHCFIKFEKCIDTINTFNKLLPFSCERSLYAFEAIYELIKIIVKSNDLNVF